MGVEIERKFLVDHAKWGRLSPGKGTHYRQGYLVNQQDRTVRVRVSDEEGFLNLKSRDSDVSRREYEYGIPLEDAQDILEKFALNGTEKIRYRIGYEGHEWEVDVFLGANTGLIIAEIELSDEQELFEKPAWVGQEVTSDPRYTNASLALHPYGSWHVT